MSRDSWKKETDQMRKNAFEANEERYERELAHAQASLEAHESGEFEKPTLPDTTPPEIDAVKELTDIDARLEGVERGKPDVLKHPEDRAENKAKVNPANDSGSKEQAQKEKAKFAEGVGTPEGSDPEYEDNE